MAFVRGDRPGLVRLQRVLPNIFRAFPTCNQEAVLAECGLNPCEGPHEGFLSFYLNPEREGYNMLRPPYSPPVMCGQGE